MADESRSCSRELASASIKFACSGLIPALAVVVHGLAGCGGEALPSTLAFTGPDAVALRGDVLVLPVQCVKSHPAYFGREWLPEDPSSAIIHRNQNQNPCTPEMHAAVDLLVRAGLEQQGYRIVTRPTPLVGPELDTQSSEERAHTLGALGVASVARVAMSFWGLGGRVSIVIATAASAYARSTTCKIEMYLSTTSFEGDVDQVLERAAQCALRELRGSP